MANRKRSRANIRSAGHGAAAAGPDAGRSGPGLAASAWRRDAERRALTLLFVDIVRSTALVSRLDPEDLAEIFNAFHETCSSVVDRFEGRVAKDLGDGLDAYFGWPQSHENDAERAVLCGLALVDAVKAIPVGKEDRLRIRVGIATGEAVVGDFMRMSSGPVREVFGALPTLAARLQAASSPDCVLISAATYQLVRHKFVCVDAGRKKLKGFPEPVQVYQVVGPRQLSLNFDARRAAGLTPFIGRDAEMQALTERWRQAVGGNGQIVMLGGDPGIGKSRLCAEWGTSLSDQAVASFSFQCSPLHRDSPLYPVTRSVAQIAGLANSDAPEVKLRKLMALFEETRGERLEGISLLANHLGIPIAAGSERQILESQKRLTATQPRRRQALLHQLLVNYLLGSGKRAPVLIVFEDIHWMDPTTAELIDTLIDRIRSAPVMLLLTARPLFATPWPEPAHQTRLMLERLTRGQAMQFIDTMAATSGLTHELVTQLVERSDGNPLYIEELTATVLGDRGAVKADAGNGIGTARVRIPSTLQESLLARIDRTSSPARELMQICAVVGRRFSHAQIAAIAAGAGGDLDETLAELIRQGLLQVSGEPPDLEYSFKHALVQETAYSLILRDKRQRLHGKCAAALETHFPAVCAQEHGVLGLHHEIAGNIEAALPYFLAAGDEAIERGALREATSYLQKGLTLLATLPKSDARDRQELKFRSGLGRASIFANGWAHPSVKKEYGLALELASRAGKIKEQIPLEWALTTSHLLRGEMRKAVAGGQTVLGLAEQTNDQDSRHVAHSALTIYSFYAGAFTDALRHKDETLRFYREESSEVLQRNFGTDRLMQAQRGAALAYWCLGDHQTALDLDEEQRLRPKKSGHLYDYVYALTISCILHSLRRDAEMTRAFAEEANRLAQDHGFSFLQANAANFLAIASAQAEPDDRRLQDCDKVIGEYQAAGNRMGISSMYAILGEICGGIGRHERGLGYVDKALHYAKQSGERFALSDIYRVKGELLLDLKQAEAEACLGQAVATARKQQAKTWEFAAAVPLAEILLGRGANRQALNLFQSLRLGFEGSGFPAARRQRADALCAQYSTAAGAARGTVLV